MKKLSVAILSTLILTGCSVSANDIETASYKTIESVAEQKIEIRQYDPVMLVETPMDDDGRNSAFRRLFNYISGENTTQSDIAMTAPVVMDEKKEAKEGQKIPMTAPVFMDEKDTNSSQEIPMTAPVFMGNDTDAKPMMSFVLPSKYTPETAPMPTNEMVSRVCLRIIPLPQ